MHSYNKYASGEVLTEFMSTYFALRTATLPISNWSLKASTGYPAFYWVKWSVPQDGTPEE